LKKFKKAKFTPLFGTEIINSFLEIGDDNIMSQPILAVGPPGAPDLGFGKRRVNFNWWCFKTRE
jgi:hypothetical protein